MSQIGTFTQLKPPPSINVDVAPTKQGSKIKTSVFKDWRVEPSIPMGFFRDLIRIDGSVKSDLGGSALPFNLRSYRLR